MLPTSSRSDLVGKNARSVTARINWCSSSRRATAPSARLGSSRGAAPPARREQSLLEGFAKTQLRTDARGGGNPTPVEAGTTRVVGGCGRGARAGTDAVLRWAGTRGPRPLTRNARGVSSAAQAAGAARPKRREQRDQVVCSAGR